MKRKPGKFMKLPLGGFEYTVLWVDDLKDEAGARCFGMQSSADRTIELDMDMEPDQAVSTLLHECMHAVSCVYGLNLSEIKVRCLEVGLFQMLGSLLKTLK
jgi:hypothetical protein